QIDPLALGLEDPPSLLGPPVLGDVHLGHRLEEVDQVPTLVAQDYCGWLDLADDPHRNADRTLIAQDEQITGRQIDGLANDLFRRVMRLDVVQGYRGRTVGRRSAHARPPASGVESSPGGSIPNSLASLRS